MATHKKGIQKIEEIIRLCKADLHIHSHYSDGYPTIGQILAYVENHTDLDCIAITDHDTILGALEAKEIMRRKKYRFELIIGEEVSSRDGHIVGLYLHKPVPPGLSARKTIKLIHEQRGIAIAAHPFERTRFNNPHMVIMDGVGGNILVKNRHYFDGIEIVNATPTLDDENFKASALNKTVLGLTETGSSDAHIPEAIGRAYTLYEGQTAKDLKKALRNGQTQAMLARWTVMALLKYLFFFIPIGIRLVINTIVQGKRPIRDGFE